MDISSDLARIEIEAAEAGAAKNDAALDELEKLVAKRKQLEDKKVLEAYHNSGKTADEIIAFIMSGEDKPEEDKKKQKEKKTDLRVKK